VFLLAGLLSKHFIHVNP